MPLPRWVARFNRHVLNHLMRPLARRLPGFGVVLHIGRKTSRQYSTPVNLFRRDDTYIIALSYGRDSDWVRNVLASGGCGLETRGRTLRLTRPRLFHDEQCLGLPAPIQWLPRLFAVADFLELKVVCAGGG
jgi:deazaflavin-dependent oxidoreductase (nitroreductase family)